MRAGGPAAVGPPVGWPNGGNSALATRGVGVADPVAHGGVAVARLVGDRFERALRDDGGTEHLITAMERLGRLEEESSAEGIVHDQAA